MMYILTQDEYDALRNDVKVQSLTQIKKMQKLCTQIADTMPVRWTWGDGKINPRPWGCIITLEKEGEEWYCDECPVQEICPSNRKSYSQ
jgi:hypothetical protein